MSLLTIDDILPYLSPEATASSLSANDTVLLNNVIEGIEKFVESYIGNPLSLVSNTEYLSGSGKSYVSIGYIPTGNLSLYIDNAREFSTDTLVDSSEYVIKVLERKVEFINGMVFPVGKYNVKVVYDTGWTATTLPFDLKMVIADIVANTYNHVRNSSEALATRGGMGTNVTYIQDKLILPQHYHILNIYRKANV